MPFGSRPDTRREWPVGDVDTVEIVPVSSLISSGVLSCFSSSVRRLFTRCCEPVACCTDTSVFGSGSRPDTRRERPVGEVETVEIVPALPTSTVMPGSVPNAASCVSTVPLLCCTA